MEKIVPVVGCGGHEEGERRDQEERICKRML